MISSPDAKREWLYGWDPTPGIVSVHADSSGQVMLWRRQDGALQLERDRFRPWLYAEHLGHLEGVADSADLTTQELEGAGTYRFLISAPDWRNLKDALLQGARRSGRAAESLNDLPEYYSVGLTEQYLMQSGRTYFRDLEYSDLRRMQIDLETTGFRASEGQIFMVSIRDSSGFETVLEGDETVMLRELVRAVQTQDPDVIENHNLMGFDLPFLEARAAALGVRLELGRQRHTLRKDGRESRYCAPGRELIDTLDAVWRHDFVTRELPSHGLKAVARHFGLAAPDRVYLKGSEIASTYRRDPERVRAYALEDVREVDRLSQRLLPATFALAKLAPRKFERVSSAGTATGILEPMLVRAYVRAGRALPRSQHAHLPHPHEGGAVQLFARGVARNAVKADIASLYPSVMRAYRIGPQCDELQVLLALVEAMTETRLEHKAIARCVGRDDPRFAHSDAMQAALKLIINSAYGYLAAGDMALFADRAAADRITETGRQILRQVLNGLLDHRVTLLEADTDGVFFSLPDGITEEAARAIVQSVSDTLPSGINLEFDAMYTAMLSHDLKNYALLHRDGKLTLRGVAFRSVRFEPFGARFLERAVRSILENDLPGVRAAYLETVTALRNRALRARDVVVIAKLKKSRPKYLETRDKLREAAYEAALQSGLTWLPGERIRWYRAAGGRLVALSADPDSGNPLEDATDYDAQHYLELFQRTFVNRLEHAFSPEVHAAVFRSGSQDGLFDAPLETMAVRWV